MIQLHQPELVRERQDVEAERRRHDPLRDGTGHVVLPAPVRGVPLTRVGSVEQDVRDDARYGDDDEEHRADRGDRQPDVGLHHGTDVRLYVVRDVSLQDRRLTGLTEETPTRR